MTTDNDKSQQVFGVPPSECTMKRSLYNQVMRATKVSLNANMLPVVEAQGEKGTMDNLCKSSCVV